MPSGICCQSREIANLSFPDRPCGLAHLLFVCKSSYIKSGVEMDDLENLLDERAAEVRHFGSGEVADIFGIEPWELHRILSRYELTSSGQLGTGRGSRRWFTKEDIYKIGTARFLIEDGFSREMVSSIVQTLEDRDFYGAHNECGDFSEMGIFLRRSKKDRTVGTFRSDALPEIRVGGPIYYSLNLDQITRQVDRTIQEKDRNKEKK
jgi:hypothetical protein